MKLLSLFLILFSETGRTKQEILNPSHVLEGAWEIFLQDEDAFRPHAVFGDIVDGKF